MLAVLAKCKFSELFSVANTFELYITLFQHRLEGYFLIFHVWELNLWFERDSPLLLGLKVCPFYVSVCTSFSF